jgi:hypothetical protein
MRIVYPFEFEVVTKEIDAGIQWLTLRLKNIGDETVRSLEVKLYSLDTYGISILGTGNYIFSLNPDEEVFQAFQVSANATTDLYASVSGFKGTERFWVDSPWATIKVGKEVAELESMFALTEPYTLIGKVVKVEARVKGLKDSKGLDLEFSVDLPSGKSKKLEKIEIKELSAGQEARYTTEITPKESGFFTVHAYLYHHWKRIGHRTDNLWVEK